MLIDPFTIVAQVLNFLILIWLLRRVLYGPVTRAMDEREARIQRDVDEARRLHEDAAAAREDARRQVAAFAAEREQRLAEAHAEVETWRQTRLEQVRAEIDASRERWQTALAHEQQGAISELRRRAGHEVLVLASGVLHELAGTGLEDRIITRFLDRLRALPPAERERLLAAAVEDGHRIHIQTSAPLAPAERTRLLDDVREVLGAPLTAHFDTSSDVGSGIALRAGGLMVAWSLREYLNTLEERLGTAFGDSPVSR